MGDELNGRMLDGGRPGGELCAVLEVIEERRRKRWNGRWVEERISAAYWQGRKIASEPGYVAKLTREGHALWELDFSVSGVGEGIPVRERRLRCGRDDCRASGCEERKGEDGATHGNQLGCDCGLWRGVGAR